MFDKNNNDIEFKKESNAGALIGVLLILAAITGYVFLAKPVMTDAATKKVEVTTKEQELTDLKAQVEEFEKSKSELQLATEVQRRESLNAVPVEVDQDEVIRDLMGIAEKNNILLSSIGFSKGVSTQEGVGILRISSSFEGNYNDLTNFLQGLETNPRIFRVATINVQIRKLDFVDIERANFSLSIETFYQQ